MTDISKSEAKKLMTDLETMYKQLKSYYGRDVIKPIPGFVIRDLVNFPDIPIDAAQRVAAGGGLTKGNFTGYRSADGTFRPKDGSATFYAVDTDGVPLHEAVHAFCYLAFGTGGPIWYAEGMAELGQYWRGSTDAVNTDPRVLAFLQAQPPRMITEISDENDLDPGTWRDYAWRWALCHFLANHSKHTKKFHAMGMSYLKGGGATFTGTFASDTDQLVFEFLLFLKNMEQGYRVDLCEWQWGRARPFGAGVSKRVRISAKKGWQPSKGRVTKGVTYELTTSGTWKLQRRGKSVGADGADGVGKLEGVILTDDYMLSEPFVLGVESEWTAPEDGQLYMRCGDKWGSLADNSGTMTVTIKRPK